MLIINKCIDGIISFIFNINSKKYAGNPQTFRILKGTITMPKSLTINLDKLKAMALMKDGQITIEDVESCSYSAITKDVGFSMNHKLPEVFGPYSSMEIGVSLTARGLTPEESIEEQLDELKNFVKNKVQTSMVAAIKEIKEEQELEKKEEIDG